MRKLKEQRERAQAGARACEAESDSVCQKSFEDLAAQLKQAMVELTGLLAEKDARGEGRQLCSVACRLVFDSIIARVKHQMAVAEALLARGSISPSSLSRSISGPVIQTVRVIGRNTDSISFVPFVNWSHVSDANRLSSEAKTAEIERTLEQVLAGDVYLASERTCTAVHTAGSRNLRIERIKRIDGRGARLVLTPAVGKDECVFIRTTCAIALAIGERAEDNTRYMDMADVLQKAVRQLQQHCVLLTELCELKICQGSPQKRACVRVLLGHGHNQTPQSYVSVRETLQNGHCVDVEYYIGKLRSMLGGVLERMRVHENAVYPALAPPGSPKLKDASLFIFQTKANTLHTPDAQEPSTPAMSNSQQLMFAAAARLGLFLTVGKNSLLVADTSVTSIASSLATDSSGRPSMTRPSQNAGDTLKMKWVEKLLFAWVPVLSKHTCNQFSMEKGCRSCDACGSKLFGVHGLTPLQIREMNVTHAHQLFKIQTSV
jgi:hypothetical protein